MCSYSNTLLIISVLFGCNKTKKKTQLVDDKKEIITTLHKPLGTKNFKKTEKKQIVNEVFAWVKLDVKNAIPFFKKYGEENEDKVRIKTQYGDIDTLLYKNTPYHRANFTFLVKKNYFEGSMFHRVIDKFIIQGGSRIRMKFLRNAIK